MSNKLRIGITTRVGQASGYAEPRDCLAQDWAEFFRTVLPEADWMMLPNIGDDIIQYAGNWHLNAFIISGGNDLGAEALRDMTEINLLKLAQAESLPLLGVCRGLQLLASQYGGRLKRAETAEHPVAPHDIIITEMPYNYTATIPTQVNSFHNWLVQDCGTLTPFAYDTDHNIEGVFDRDKQILGIGWHPERGTLSANFDQKLLRNFFIKG